MRDCGSLPASTVTQRHVVGTSTATAAATVATTTATTAATPAATAVTATTTATAVASHLGKARVDLLLGLLENVD